MNRERPWLVVRDVTLSYAEWQSLKGVLGAVRTLKTKAKEATREQLDTLLFRLFLRVEEYDKRRQGRD